MTHIILWNTCVLWCHTYSLLGIKATKRSFYYTYMELYKYYQNHTLQKPDSFYVGMKACIIYIPF